MLSSCCLTQDLEVIYTKSPLKMNQVCAMFKQKSKTRFPLLAPALSLSFLTSAVPSVTLVEELKNKGVEILGLQLDPSRIDLGEMQVEEEKLASFFLTNPTSSAVSFSVSLGIQLTGSESVRISFSEDELETVFNDRALGTGFESVLQPLESRKICFTCSSTLAGRQNQMILVKDLSKGQQFTLSVVFRSLLPQYLQFPDLEQSKQLVLDLGLCYIDPAAKYSKVTPFRIENISNVSQVVSFLTLTSPSASLQ
jgi:hypothetical protein